MIIDRKDVNDPGAAGAVPCDSFNRRRGIAKTLRRCWTRLVPSRLSLRGNAILLGLMAACTSGWPVTTAAAAPGDSRASEAERRIRFNGRPLSESDTKIVAWLEQQYGGRIRDGAYWYDSRTGAFGMWGGPTTGFTAPGLGLGGPLPANASGGNGGLTGVFINGRELHPVDVVILRAVLGQVWPGRWWVDAQGNAGAEGGPMMFNLFLVARQNGAAAGNGGGGGTHYIPGLGRSNSPSIIVGPGGTVTSTSGYGTGH